MTESQKERVHAQTQQMYSEAIVINAMEEMAIRRSTYFTVHSQATEFISRVLIQHIILVYILKVWKKLNKPLMQSERNASRSIILGVK